MSALMRSDSHVSPFPGNGPETEDDPFLVTAPQVSESGNTPLYFDVLGMLDGTIPEPPAPVLLERTDGHCLMYPGSLNVLFGDPECGKTMIADAAAAEALNAGRRVVIIDLDHNGPASTLSRLMMLGATIEKLRDHDLFRYVEPEDHEHLDAVVRDLKVWVPAVVIVDSLGELMPLYDASSNSPDDFTKVHSKVIKPLTLLGSAVVAIDHLAKNTESRNLGSTGTSAKRRVIGGASLRVKLLDPFTPGKGGAALITIHKDRNGGLRATCPTGDKEPIAGTFSLSVSNDVTSWTLRAPVEGDRNPAEAAPAEDVAAIKALDPPPSSVRDARTRLAWNMQRAARAMSDWRALPVTETQGAVTSNGSSFAPQEVTR